MDKKDFSLKILTIAESDDQEEIIKAADSILLSADDSQMKRDVTGMMMKMALAKDSSSQDSCIKEINLFIKQQMSLIFAQGVKYGKDYSVFRDNLLKDKPKTEEVES